MQTTTCPKCGRKLAASGEVVVADKTLPTFQCDECLMVVDFDGEPFEMALTFALNSAGKPFDPAGKIGDQPPWELPTNSL